MGKPILDEAAMLRLPCGCTTLSRIREQNAIYVDKTEMVSSLAKNCFRPVFLSRPRRFGKSLLTDSLISPSFHSDSILIFLFYFSENYYFFWSLLGFLTDYIKKISLFYRNSPKTLIEYW